MSASLPIEVLLLVAQATPEQQAAVKRFLLGVPGGLGASAAAKGRCELGNGGGLMEAVLRVERKVEAVQAAVSRTAVAVPEAPVSGREAHRVFVLLQRLENAPKERKAPLATVFRLLVFEGLSRRSAAERCRCATSVVCTRAQVIERVFGITVERLRSLASELLSLESAVKGDRHRKRKHGAPDDFGPPDSDDEADDPHQRAEEPDWDHSDHQDSL